MPGLALSSGYGRWVNASFRTRDSDWNSKLPSVVREYYIDAMNLFCLFLRRHSLVFAAFCLSFCGSMFAEEKKTPEGMVWVPGGTFTMGSEKGQEDEKPVHKITVDGFWMDKTCVTNEQFEAFVKASGYVTVAEKTPDPKDFPGAPPELLVAGSVVFSPPPGEVPLDNHMIWWKYQPGASWRHPEGPDSNLKGRGRHPVVHVCFFD